MILFALPKHCVLGWRVLKILVGPVRLIVATFFVAGLILLDIDLAH